MPSISPRRTALALTLTALVALPSLALAAPRDPAPAGARETHARQGAFAQFWSFLQHLWGAEGMSIDPNGRARATPALTHVSGDAGMLIDPDGAH